MVFDEGGRHRSVWLSNSGDFVIVPKGVWHTAKVATPTSMVFVTPGERTQVRPK